MTQQEVSFDVAIIGGGPGGYVAALRAAQLGMKTVLIERENLGGVCLNWGCIPTKALLNSADLLRGIRDAAAHGIAVSTTSVDINQMVSRSRQVVQRLNRGVEHLLKKAGVRVVMGEARIESPGELGVTSRDGSVSAVRATHIIVASGARARELPILPFDGDRVWSYRDALKASSVPDSMVVVGAGAIGIEFASFFATLGTKVTVVEAATRILPSSDADVSDFMQQALIEQGIHVITEARLVSGMAQSSTVGLEYEQKGKRLSLEADRVLVAVGLVGNTEGLGLETLGVTVQSGLISVGDWGATTAPRVYAIGDVTGPPMLAHKASHDGVACVEHIGGLRDGTQASTPIPMCVYSHPQSASVGLTEEQARARGRELRVGRFSLEGNGKAIAIGQTSGFVKTIFDAGSGELLGAHMVGPDVTELVHGYAIASTLETTESELMETVFPHPTLSEAMHEAVLAAYGKALHA